MSLFKNFINNKLDDILYEINDKIEKISQEINLEEFIDDINKIIDQGSYDNYYKKFNINTIIYDDLYDTHNFEDSINLYDVYYMILLEKSNDGLKNISIGNFNYPNNFTLCINNSNFWMKIFINKLDSKNEICSSLYYLNNLITVPLLGYQQEKKIHFNFESILNDIQNYKYAVRGKLVKIY